jgi:proteasome lid subunit RPN8/RPN11
MPEAVVARLIQQSLESEGREICGFIMKDWWILPIDNIARDDLEFHMHPDQQLHVQMEHGADILGVYHSHPGGLNRPSLRDAAMAPFGMRYWIIAGDTVSEWEFKNGEAFPVEVVPEVVAGSLHSPAAEL